MNTQSSSTGRWIFFIPVALIVSYIASLFITFIGTMIGVFAAVSTGHESLFQNLSLAVFGFADAAVYLAVGISLAPQPKKKAVILLVAVGVAITAVKLYMFQKYQIKFDTATIYHYVAYLLTLVLGLLFIPKPKPTFEDYLAQMKEEDSRVWAGNKVG